MAAYIIGSYSDIDRDEYPSVMGISGGILKTIGTAAIKLGLNKGKLMFFRCDEEDKDKLTDPQQEVLNRLKDKYASVVFYLDREVLHTIMNSVGSKYPQRMDHATYQLYTAEEAEAISKVMVKVREYVKPVPTNSTGLKVGDIISVCVANDGSYYLGTTNAIITKVTDKSYSYVKWLPIYGGRTAHFPLNGAVRTGCDAVGDFSAPIRGNEDFFKMSRVITKRFSKEGDYQESALKEDDKSYNRYHYDWDCYD